jgi:hypothetical protein
MAVTDMQLRGKTSHPPEYSPYSEKYPAARTAAMTSGKGTRKASRPQQCGPIFYTGAQDVRSEPLVDVEAEIAEKQQHERP